MLNWLGGRHLVILTVGLCAIGLALVLSASAVPAELLHGSQTAYLKLHIGGLAIGVALAVAASQIPLTWLRALAYPAWAIAVLLLAATLIPGLGIERNGSARWIALGPLQFQPLEFAKLAVVVSLAHALACHAERVRDIRVGLLLPGLMAGVPAGLLLLQPDFGGAAMICACAAIMTFVAGARISHLLAGAAPALLGAGVLLMTRAYTLGRIHSWLNRFEDTHGSDYQPLRALLGFAAGGLFGNGLGRGEQRFYLPEAHTDYIFSVAGEELGLLGVALILFAFLGIAWSSIAVALRSPKPFPMLLAVGAGLLLWLQAALNTAVALDLLPAKGTTLPFLSYGRSSLIASMAALSLVLSVARGPGLSHGSWR
jgi:cell division protein FtsW